MENGCGVLPLLTRIIHPAAEKEDGVIKLIKGRTDVPLAQVGHAGQSHNLE